MPLEYLKVEVNRGYSNLFFSHVFVPRYGAYANLCWLVLINVYVSLCQLQTFYIILRFYSVLFFYSFFFFTEAKAYIIYTIAIAFMLPHLMYLYY